METEIEKCRDICKSCPNNVNCVCQHCYGRAKKCADILSDCTQKPTIEHTKECKASAIRRRYVEVEYES